MKFLEMIVTMVLAITLSYIVGKYDYFPTMSRSISATPYEYFVFAQQSPFVFCLSTDCKGGPLPKIFTIHGLWPSNKSGYIGPCSSVNFNRSVVYLSYLHIY
ncbi:unnamed protein product [Prunus armeniaca]|uniref:Uncharacterized protein n=1 Tax=Prunus armeniaca TaxID=36596 RepID=A0A6J5YBH1_PRUAR|nr:unnamed protein product [Prunus armeniaca]